MKTGKNREAPATNWQEILLRLLGGTGLAFAVVLILLLCATFAVSQGHLSQDRMEGAVLSICVVAAFVGGLYLLQKNPKNGLIWGSILGLSLFLLLLFLGYLCYPQTTFANNGLQILFSCLVGGSLAKILRNKKKKNH